MSSKETHRVESGKFHAEVVLARIELRQLNEGVDVEAICPMLTERAAETWTASTDEATFRLVLTYAKAR